MANKDFDFLVFIGRFQPFHNGQLGLIQTALEYCEQVIILCGSAHQPPTIRNPWSFEERQEMIRGAVSEALTQAENDRIHIAPLLDLIYSEETWINNAQDVVNDLVQVHYPSLPTSLNTYPTIGLIGHSKDNSAYYSRCFPQWEVVDVAVLNMDSLEAISGSAIREAIFISDDLGKIADQVPKNILSAVRKFSGTRAYTAIKAEHEFVLEYKQAWSAAPYPPMFVTVDAVLIHSGHILMIERKGRPGQGLLALPGGFVEAEEKIVDACLRELDEETCLGVSRRTLLDAIKGREVFDDPYRSARGRTITHCFFIELEPDIALPEVQGGDDAKHAMWIPLATLDPAEIFEDHYSIIQKMTPIIQETRAIIQK